MKRTTRSGLIDKESEVDAGEFGAPKSVQTPRTFRERGEEADPGRLRMSPIPRRNLLENQKMDNDYRMGQSYCSPRISMLAEPTNSHLLGALDKFSDSLDRNKIANLTSRLRKNIRDKNVDINKLRDNYKRSRAYKFI